MSRLRLYLQGVASSYISLAATVVYSLVSVPLALKFLSNAQYGLWGLLSQYVSYLWLVDAGMSPSVGRLLIERKDHRDDGSYGGLILTGCLVGLAQAAIVIVIGLILPESLSRLSKIPPDLNGAFCSLVRWQSVITAAMFATRVFRSVLYAHQRNDLINITLATSSIVGLATLWAALHWNGGILSILWANASALVLIALATVGACAGLGFLPARGAWGRPAWIDFKALFAYGKDILIVQVGGMLAMAAQPIIVSRNLGLEAVAAWSVGTKAFFLVFSLIYQALDTSGAAFTEMMVRGETERLRDRFVGMVVIAQTVAGVAAVVYATCNSLFISVWTHGRIAWPASYDVLLGTWLLVLVLAHACGGLIVLTKRLGWFRYVLLLEGITFIALACLLTKWGGITTMIACSLVCSFCFRGAYTVWRIRRHFEFRKLEWERRWFVPLARILACAIPAGLIVYWATVSLGSVYRFLICLVVAGGAGAFSFYRWGIPVNLRTELILRAPPLLGSWLKRIL